MSRCSLQDGRMAGTSSGDIDFQHVGAVMETCGMRTVAFYCVARAVPFAMRLLSMRCSDF